MPILRCSAHFNGRVASVPLHSWRKATRSDYGVTDCLIASVAWPAKLPRTTSNPVDLWPTIVELICL